MKFSLLIIYCLLCLAVFSCAHSNSSESLLGGEERFKLQKLFTEFAFKQNNCKWLPDLSIVKFSEVKGKDLNYLRKMYNLPQATSLASLSFDSYCGQKGSVLSHVSYEKQDKKKPVLVLDTLKVISVEFYGVE